MLIHLPGVPLWRTVLSAVFQATDFIQTSRLAITFARAVCCWGYNEKNKTIVIFVFIFIPKWQTSRANWWQRSGGYLASQNCRLCSARSIVVLVGGLTQAIGCGYRLANNLLRSRVGGVRKVGYSRCLDCGELGCKAWWKQEKRRGVG